MSALKPSTTTIVLIAPSPQRRTLVAQQLEALGYSVIALDDGAIDSALATHRYDLLVIDLSDGGADQHRALAARAAALLKTRTPLLMLTPDQQTDAEAWTQETLSYRVAAALRNHVASDVLSERRARWDQLNVLDPDTLFFSRRYLDAIFPLEVERSRRIHQPVSLLLIALDRVLLADDDHRRSISARLLSSLRQTDFVVRFDETVVLLLLPATEIAMARVVALRLLKTLEAVAQDNPALRPRIGLAAYPQHGATAKKLLASAQHALSYALEPGTIIGSDQL
jgi:diguanylate cyclase (GGDEF)-like protein